MKARDAAVIANIALLAMLLAVPIYLVWVTQLSIRFVWAELNEFRKQG